MALLTTSVPAQLPRWQFGPNHGLRARRRCRVGQGRRGNTYTLRDKACLLHPERSSQVDPRSTTYLPSVSSSTARLAVFHNVLDAFARAASNEHGQQRARRAPHKEPPSGCPKRSDFLRIPGAADVTSPTPTRDSSEDSGDPLSPALLWSNTARAAPTRSPARVHTHARVYTGQGAASPTAFQQSLYSGSSSGSYLAKGREKDEIDKRRRWTKMIRAANKKTWLRCARPASPRSPRVFARQLGRARSAHEAPELAFSRGLPFLLPPSRNKQTQSHDTRIHGEGRCERSLQDGECSGTLRSAAKAGASVSE
ncbi:hypothetical protein HPB47_007396 [Ixodes persulcatus]|uniref:Uncharacterized protein n=1 Tax=Ixodes persulcatus TaxID=34615 RepID=A0AC60P7N0_IXOPE|nr:hypothetical protein HPB47_007396 [Ixodes persulcatus]